MEMALEFAPRERIDRGKTMSTEARGQLLGYCLQFPRALLRLLELTPGGAVGIEIDGDVSAFSPEGIKISEEDKSSIRRDALTDMSTNLWKTFYNWCKLIQARDDINFSNIRFILYTNHSVAGDSLVQEMSDAETNCAINQVVTKTREIFGRISNSHSIYPYLFYLLNEEIVTFQEVISHFELATHSNTAELYEDIDNVIKTKYVPEVDIQYIREQLEGWLQNQISMKISRQESPIITFDEFNHKCIELFQRSRSKSLVDFSIHKLPLDDALQKEANARPVYIQQLEAIGSDSSELIEAVSDFLRANVNRQEWIEHDYVDEDTMIDFQNRLQSYYTTRRKQISLIYSDRPPEVQGKILLGDCKTRNESLNGMTPPDKTISGTYHFLSNQRFIGWHPQWENIFKDKDN